MADGLVVTLPLTEDNGWLPDLESVDNALGNVNVLWLNYPNNPTGAVADLEFFSRVVHWAKRNEVIVAHDNPYSEVTYDGFVAPSFLQIPGAKDIGVEFNSLSKTYSMAGYRIGMVAGNREIIEVLGRIKSNIDSGIYGAIQDVAITAITGDQSWIPERNLIYRHRRDKLCDALTRLGLHAPPPKASLYIWARVPGGLESRQFADYLLAEAAIAVTPGPSYGTQGEGYVRLSLTVPDEQVDEACRRLAKLDLGKAHESAVLAASAEMRS
jgi:LL-diaminopimelate aminotransferase